MYSYMILLGTARGMGIFGLKFEKQCISSSNSIVVIIVIIIISLFKVGFTITFHNYKKPVNVSLPMRPDTNSVTK